MCLAFAKVFCGLLGFDYFSLIGVRCGNADSVPILLSLWTFHGWRQGRDAEMPGVSETLL